MKSTMGAILTPAEEAHIIDRWAALQAVCRRPAELPYPDPVEMLDVGVDLIRAVHELRYAIDDGWHAANRRAFPGPRPKAAKRPTGMSDLAALGITQADLEAILAEKEAK